LVTILCLRRAPQSLAIIELSLQYMGGPMPDKTAVFLIGMSQPYKGTIYL